MGTVLVVARRREVLLALRLGLQRAGWNVVAMDSAVAAAAALRGISFDAVVVQVSAAGEVELVRDVAGVSGPLPLILLEGQRAQVDRAERELSLRFATHAPN